MLNILRPPPNMVSWGGVPKWDIHHPIDQLTDPVIIGEKGVMVCVWIEMMMVVIWVDGREGGMIYLVGPLSMLLFLSAAGGGGAILLSF